MKEKTLGISFAIKFCKQKKNPVVKAFHYHISSVIRQFFSFQNKPKDLDPSYKMDLDLWDCLGRVKLVLQQNFIGQI